MTARGGDAELVLVGRVRRVHGVRGEVVVETLSDVEGRFARGAELSATPPGGARRRLTVGASRPFRNGWLMRFEGLATRDDVEPLCGAELYVDPAASPPAPRGAYYHHELIGCRCRDRRAGDLGMVADVLEDGGGLLLRLAGPAGDLLVPFVRAYLGTIDVAGGTIELDLPEGLIETCGSTS